MGFIAGVKNKSPSTYGERAPSGTSPGPPGPSSGVVILGLTTTAMPSSGMLAYFSADHTVAPAIASSFPAARVVGVYEGAPGQINESGTIPDAQFDSADPAVAGQPCWLSPSTAGFFTTVAPVVIGQVVAPVGTIKEGAASGSPTSVELDLGEPTQL